MMVMQNMFVDPTPAEEREARKQVGQARTSVAAVCRFFGHLVLKLEVVIAYAHHRVDTAAVTPDGVMYVNHLFIKGLSPAEVAGLVVHEVLHPALLCWRRQGSRRAMLSGPNGITFSLWNLAHDLSFNPEIVEMASKCKPIGKIKLPKDAALDPRFAKQSAEQIYDTLLKEAKKKKKKGGGGQGQPGGKGGKPGGKGGKPQPGQGNGPPVEGHLDNIPGGGKHGIGDDLRSDLSPTDVGKRAAKGDKGAQKKLENDWRVTVVAAAIAHERHHGRGTLPAGFQKLVDELQESKVDWTDVLSQWIGENGNREDFTYRRPSRRSESCGAYMASYQKYGVDDVVILWDTSGSMNSRETGILSEVHAICEDLGLVLRIICIDSKIHSDTRNVSEAQDMIGQIKGGGGSDFNPAFDRLEDESFDGVVIAFTDGHIGVPSTKPPLLKDVLWCIEPQSGGYCADQDPTGGQWGQVLVMDD
jgi:predicted metal-dependent peptidase